MPLAREGYRVTGIDTSGFALRRARQHAREAGVEVELIKGDLVDVLGDSGRQFDIVICAEVIYLCKDYREMLQQLAAAVRPGGLLCVSHRSKFYYIYEGMRLGDPDSAVSALRSSEGPFRELSHCNWQTAEELKTLYEQVGMRQVALYPIDRLAWLTGLRLAELTEAQRNQWMELELSMPQETGTCARYMLMLATPRRMDQ